MIADITYANLRTDEFGRSTVSLSGNSRGQVSLAANLRNAGDLDSNGISDVTEFASGALAQSFNQLYFHNREGISSYDLNSGVTRFIGPVNESLTDIAFSPAGDLYGVAEDTLFRIDRDNANVELVGGCLLYTSPSPRDRQKSRMPSSA